MFKPVSPKVDFIEIEKRLLDWWYSSGIISKYLHKNDSSSKKFSFLDGPITANNPMGVHHAWGRTYKDLWQRYYNMKDAKQRFQYGFDCQGLWVEVEVEKELGFKTKKDIEEYGVDKFVEKCKERVRKYSAIQTEQSKRLGYFMDWKNSYFTMSDENNYAIWSFLKTCWQNGWIYKGHDVVPWCPRCETAISQHEMLTEDYKEITHKTVIIKLPIVGKENEYLLVWTTTPWTVPSNVCVAVDENLEYSQVEFDNNYYWAATETLPRIFPNAKVIKKIKGKDLVGFKYKAPYDHLDAAQKAGQSELFHTVIPTDPLIMPINTEEGVGLVHTAPGTGEEDFKLGKKLGLPVISAIDDSANYLDGFGELTGLNAKKHPELILDYLEKNNWAFKIENYTHRYPACWRCKAELVWKVADEWYISMDLRPSQNQKSKIKNQNFSLREQLIENSKKINWIPSFGLDRELDWLNNMHDWLISKKNRYWGLALPIYECPKCHNFEVIGSKQELKEKAVSGWEKFEGHSPHKPFIDEIKIKCSSCGETAGRIKDVGNPWLDAGIVSISTLPENWFPADFITESFPGQFKNWFYSLLVMSTVLKNTAPFKTVLGYASLLAEDGRPMHKSWGNAIEFNEGADKIGVDVMRWLYVTHNPTDNLLFGYKAADEVRRKFHLLLWNIYVFFVTYANLNKWEPHKIAPKHILDKWITSRLNKLIEVVSTNLDKYDGFTASIEIQKFVEDLSTWYVRRSRDRKDKDDCNATLYHVLITLCKILAPFNPFISEEIFKNLTEETSVHLTSWPKTDASLIDAGLEKEMVNARQICELGHSERKSNNTKVRQPLKKIIYSSDKRLSQEIEAVILEELNVKNIEFQKDSLLEVELDLELTPELIDEGKARDIVREIQSLRKEAGCSLDEIIEVELPSYPKLFEDYIKKETLAASLKISEKTNIIRPNVKTDI